MRKLDVLFLLLVLGFAGTFSAMSVSKAVALLPGRSAGDLAETAGAAGKARDADIDQLLRMLGRQELSDREAEFYQEFPAVPRSEQNE